MRARYARTESEMSKKKTFVTLEQLKEIDKTYPTPYHYMMRRVSGIMQEDLRKHLHGIRDTESTLQ